MNKNYLLGIGMLLAVLAVSVTPALAHVDVYFSPDPSNITLAPGENVTIQVLAEVDANENGIRSFQIGIDFDDDFVEFTNVENPCLVSLGGTCYVNWWTPFCYLNLFPWNDSQFQWTTGSSSPGTASPVIAPIKNITIEAIAPGTSPLTFTHTIRYEPSIAWSQINDMTPATIPEENITWMDSSITVTGPPTTCTIPVTLGWNLKSPPLTPIDNSVSEVLSTVSYDAVRQYNATTKEFEDAATMDPGTGYFVNVTTAGTWVYEGTPVSSTSPGLEPGLNMIGVPNCSMDVGAAMGSADYWYVSRWNADHQKYEVYYSDPSISSFNTFTEMTAGEGYFVAATVEESSEFEITCSS